MPDVIDPEVGADNIRIEPGDDDDFEEYAPIPAILHDAGVIIFDPIEFAEKFNCHAAQLFEGNLLVLNKDNHRWITIEPVLTMKAVK